ncbi:hypothetical protein [Diaphorobacter ruginosibacter]|uniref:hypothetical protein n=1 Tax=Diaphorobacter ruginosibacter TaxID=1715720 RepID=UPI00333F3D07
MDMKLTAKMCIAGLAWMGSMAMAASNFTVSPGNWVVTQEVNGQPGRGMGIEVRDGTLVMAVYNYAPTGEATFHLAAGAMNGNSFSGQLMEYRGGRYLGGPALDAAEVGSAGEVRIDFSSATTGTIKFPGEPAVDISRYVFDGVPQGRFLPPGMGEVWLLTKNMDGYFTESSGVAINDADGRMWSDDGECQVNADTAAVTCPMTWDSWSSATVTLKRYGQRVEGTVSRRGSSSKDRVVGARLALLRFRGDMELMFDTESMDWFTGEVTTSSVPEAGLWIISGENTGKPGRGLTMDLQLDTLVVQLYGYEADGSPTFRIGSGKYKGGSSTVALQKVRGGRYYGSDALTGIDAGSDGNAQIRFTSPTTGMILLPAEQWVPMQKFSVGVMAPQPESLLGKWAFFVAGAGGGREHTVFDLTRVDAGRAKNSSGSAQCWYETTRHGTVRCTDFRGEYRFTPAYNDGAIMGWAMETGFRNEVIENGNHGRIPVQRVVDRTGVISGSLPR